MQAPKMHFGALTSVSLQLYPSPWYPGLHLHSKSPFSFMHCPSGEQSFSVVQSGSKISRNK